jgi:hypothetical protein
MANLITQPDNAVIDYTTITAMINAINTLQSEIDNINAAVGKTPGGSTKTVQAGHMPINSPNQTITINFDTPFSTKPEVVGTVMYGGGTPLYCYMPHSIALDSVTFTLNAKVPKGTAYVYWVAVGTV